MKLTSAPSAPHSKGLQILQLPISLGLSALTKYLLLRT